MTAQEAFELEVLDGKYKPKFEDGRYKVTDVYTGQVQELWEVYRKGLDNQYGVKI